MANSFGTDILIQSPNPRKAAEFYVELLGFTITSEAPMFELKGASVNFYIDEGPAIGPVLEVFVPSVEIAKRCLVAHGCALVRDEPAVPRCYVRDPFGMTYNLAKRPEVRTSMTFPAAVPEVPVTSIAKAVIHYVDVLGFTLDWGDEESGIAGISRGNCRLFLTNRGFAQHHGNISPTIFWLNVESKDQVDKLYREWKVAQSKIVSAPEDKPWKLREFLVADLDDNLIRVFYDFRSDI